MRRGTVWPALALCLTACVDYEGVVASNIPDVEVLAPQFQRDVYAIVERRCAVGGCHSEMSHQAGLYLSPDSAYAALVNRSSRLFPSEVFVRPGDATNSWMIIAISDDATRRPGLSRMPLGSGSLTQNQIRTIMNWINRGAPND